MKAVVFTGPNHLELEEISDPIPAYDEVLIRVKCVGICGTDLHLFDGSIGYFKTGLLNYPVIPGHEWSGEIVQVGPGVRNFHCGDRVTGECHIGCGECEFCSQGQPNQCPDRSRVGILGKQGAFAEFITMPARSVHTLPPGVGYRTGALTEPLTVALYALEKVALLAGKSVFIHGLGTIGCFVLELAKMSGASLLIGLDILPERIEFARRSGAHVFHGKSPDIQERVLDLAPHGVDVVVEASGSAQSLQSCLELVKPGGKISLLGLYEGQQAAIDPDLIVTKDIQIFGNMASAKVWERGLNILESKLVDSSAFITHVFPLNEVSQAFRLAMSRDAGVMKVIVDMNNELV